MSASETNTEESAKRHKTPLIGMGLVALFGVILISIFTFIAVGRGEEPVGAEQQVDGLTGDVEPADDGVSAQIEAEGASE